MPDDIVTVGGPERGSKRDAEEAIESHFHSHYPRLVRAALSSVGDQDLAEQLAQQAYLRLWRRRRWSASSDPQDAVLYLQDAIADLSRDPLRRYASQHRVRIAPGAQPEQPHPRATGPDREMSCSDRGRRPNESWPAETVQEADGRVIDTDLAWLSFLELRSGAAASRRSGLTAAVAVVAAAAIAVAALAAGGSGDRVRQPRASGLSPPARNYPGAVVARIPLSGVISVVGNAERAWVVRATSRPGTIDQADAAAAYQLVGIDLRTNTVLYRVNLGRQPRAIAAGAGKVWLTTPSGQAGGQIMEIDPASGRVIQLLHLKAGSCTELSFNSGYLAAACTAQPDGTGFWVIDPSTEKAVRLGTPVHGFVTSLVAAPDAIWYALNYSRIIGLAQIGSRPIAGRPNAGRPKRVTVGDTGHQDLSPGADGLVYDARSIWALGGLERLARIDAVTGKVVRRYTYPNYNPARTGGLDFVTAGAGWLWFINNGYPFSGVVRVSEVTGRPSGGVQIPNSCAQQVCWQTFLTPGSVWVPTGELLFRIDPSLAHR